MFDFEWHPVKTAVDLVYYSGVKDGVVWASVVLILLYLFTHHKENE
jgi:hypothetical protein